MGPDPDKFALMLKQSQLEQICSIMKEASISIKEVEEALPKYRSLAEQFQEVRHLNISRHNSLVGLKRGREERNARIKAGEQTSFESKAEFDRRKAMEAKNGR